VLHFRFPNQRARPEHSRIPANQCRWNQLNFILEIIKHIIFHIHFRRLENKSPACESPPNNIIASGLVIATVFASASPRTLEVKSKASSATVSLAFAAS